MSNPNPIDPDRRSKREREEQEKRRRDAPEQPGKPHERPEIDRPRDEPQETEEDWSRTSRRV